MCMCVQELKDTRNPFFLFYLRYVAAFHFLSDSGKMVDVQHLFVEKDHRRGLTFLNPLKCEKHLKCKVQAERINHFGFTITRSIS